MRPKTCQPLVASWSDALEYVPWVRLVGSRDGAWEKGEEDKENATDHTL